MIKKVKITIKKVQSTKIKKIISIQDIAKKTRRKKRESKIIKNKKWNKISDIDMITQKNEDCI